MTEQQPRWLIAPMASTATIKHASKARSWNGTSRLAGRGDGVIRVDPPPSGPTTIRLSHAGGGNFAIFGYGGAMVQLLVNEIGTHNGQTTLGAGAMVLEVTADGDWTITPD